MLGAGIAGLAWGFYHPDYTIVTDKLSWSVMGSTPSVVLYDNPETIRWVRDTLGLSEVPSVPLSIGYLTEDGYIHPEGALDEQERGVLFEKKMRPWMDIAASGYSDKTQRLGRFGARTGSALLVDVKAVIDEMVRVVRGRGQIMEGERVVFVDEHTFSTRERTRRYDHLVSTIPAPIFARLWGGATLG